jgi:hypothetical protein
VAFGLPVANHIAENWDKKQQAVIDADSSDRVLVEAGPGTGKTAVACARVAHLIDEQELTPAKIWLLSFTRTAVRELRDRIGSYVEHPLDAMSVKITTLDSQVWYLRQGLQDSNFENLFGSYEANIDSIIDMLRDENEALISYLGEIEHVIVDEAQDLVGSRADLVCELIRCLPDKCGFTVFADSAQAIYGWTNDSGDHNNKCSELITELRSGRWGVLREHLLDTIHRTDDPALAKAYKQLREITLSASFYPQKQREAIREKAQEIGGAALPRVTEQDLADRNDTLVLYRYRADVLSDSSFLWGKDIPHKLRMSGVPQRLSPWIARVFWDFEQRAISEPEFGALWSDRVSSNPAFGDVELEQAWKSLKHYCGNRRGTVEIKQLRRVLSRSKPPIEFVLPEDMLPGPLLGTIHASKGREAETVHLMLNGGDVFVGATRARSKFKVGNKGKSFASKVPGHTRTFKLGKKKKSPRAQVEFGLEGDIDRYSLLLSDEWKEDIDVVAENQSYLWENCLNHAKLTAEKSKDTDWVYWLDADDESCFWLASLSKRVTNDLWPIGDKVKAHYSRKRAMPTSTIWHINMVGSESVVLSDTDDMKARLLQPWCRTGIYLIPVISAYTIVYFR